MIKINRTLRYLFKFFINYISIFLREQNETIVKLKGSYPGNRLPQGLLMEGESAIKHGNHNIDISSY